MKGSDDEYLMKQSSSYMKRDGLPFMDYVCKWSIVSPTHSQRILSLLQCFVSDNNNSDCIRL